MYRMSVTRVLILALASAALVLVLLATPVLAGPTSNSGATTVLDSSVSTTTLNDSVSTTTTVAPKVANITDNYRLVIVLAVFSLLLVTGITIPVSRYYLEVRPAVEAARGGGGGSSGPGGNAPRSQVQADFSSTFLRSWVAMTLVGGLLLFVGMCFWLDDSALRNTAVGGLLSASAAAVAFYFAGKTAEDARKDKKLSSAQPMVKVPKVMNFTPNEVEAVFSSIGLFADKDYPGAFNPDCRVTGVKPEANSDVARGSMVKITFAGPIPDLTSSDFEQAKKALTAARLIIDPDEEPDPKGARVKKQDPPAGAEVPPDRKVKVTFS